MNIFFSLFIIGFTAAALPGAVQTTVFLSTLQSKAKQGITLALGASVMDGLYLFLAYYGIVEFITKFSTLKIAIGLFGFAYMLWLGIAGVRASYQTSKTNNSGQLQHGFLKGMLLVLLHIPTLFYFVGVAGSVFHEPISVIIAMLGAISLFVGALACFLLVVGIAWIGQRYSKPGLIKILQRVSAVVLMIFAIKVLLDIF